METTRTRHEKTKHVMHRCKGCKITRRITMVKCWTTVSRSDQIGSRRENYSWTMDDGSVKRGEHPPTVMCDCGRPMTSNVVKGTMNEKVSCSGKCTGSKGHVCECSCGGENHGSDH